VLYARSPDLTHCDYFLLGYVKEKVLVPPQPASIPNLKNSITAAEETFTPDMLIRVWRELDYRFDVCRVTKGAHKAASVVLGSMLASGNQVRGFESCRSRRSHVADLRHVKDPIQMAWNPPFLGKITGHFSPTVPSFPVRGLSRRHRRGGSWRRKWELPKPG
jgi:hypothetical protein